MRATHLFAFFLFLSVQNISAQQKGFYLDPSIHKNIIVFQAEGDLWKYDMNNGITIRLTSDQGIEKRPCISPDGSKIAFLAQPDGATEIYTMDILGSVPKRITYQFNQGYIDLLGWTKDGKILYNSSAYSGMTSVQMLKLDPLTLDHEMIPLAQAADGCYSESGTLYFTRFPNQGSKTKRYKGGEIEQLWSFDGKKEAVNLTMDYDGTSRNPMYYNGRIYFLSDRDGTMNIWSMNLTGKDLKQHSFSKGWDIKSASISGSSIAYQKGADIWVYDIEKNQDSLQNILLISDFNQRKTKWVKTPVSEITATAISPSGNYVALLSRGRLFVSPAKSDRWIEVNRKSGIRNRGVCFLDEKTLIVSSDQSGEYELWAVSADGSGKSGQISHDSKNQIDEFVSSPDCKWIGYNDKNNVIHIIETTTGNEKFSYKDAYYGTAQLSWSPNSLYLNFVRGLDNLTQQICVVDIRTMKLTAVTSPRMESYNASWSADNRWFCFLSERSLHTSVPSPWGPRQPEPYYNQTDLIYAMPLDTALNFPFLKTDSWLTDTIYNMNLRHSDTTKGVNKNKVKPQIPIPASPIDWEFARHSLYTVPVKNGNLSSLQIAADGFLYWINAGENSEENGAKIFSLKMSESKKYEPTEIATGVSDYTLSADKKKILITFNNKSMVVADANGQKVDVEKSKVQLDNWAFQIDPQKDWQQIFEDAWRMERDYFYDRGMHQVDWVGVRARYEALLNRITDRNELNELISDMVGELSALHTFVGGGDSRPPSNNINAGFLGALFSKDSLGLKIRHVFESDVDFPDQSSPLNKPELKIRQGDIITAVDNISLKEVEDISELLVNKVNIPVKLSLLNNRKQIYEQVVSPISAENEWRLQYNEWELTRRHITDSISEDNIGYIHLKAMTGSDMDDFVKQFYPVFNRKALIIDVRGNRGGNIDSWVLEKLMRKAWMYWQERYGGPTWNMHYAFRGPMVILCNQRTASDGEAVTEGFRRLGLGKVIGMRTWGGEIWLRGENLEVDHGVATAAEKGVYGPEGKWLIEGRGVEPDFVVDNLPFETFNGKDAQLEFAIDYLKKEIKKDPIDVIQPPPYPNKSFKY